MDTLGPLHIGRLLGILLIGRDIDQEILLRTCLVFFSSLYGISYCFRDLEIDSLGVLFLSLSIGILIERLGSQSGYLEFGRDLDGDIVRATRSSIGRP